MESATMIPEPASMSAEAVVAMIMIASFCRIGLSLKLRIVTLFLDRSGDVQQSRAETQTRRRSRPSD